MSYYTLLNAFLVLGGGQSIVFEILVGSGITPFSFMTCPRKRTSLHSRSHFSSFSFNTALAILLSTS